MSKAPRGFGFSGTPQSRFFASSSGSASGASSDRRSRKGTLDWMSGASSSSSSSDGAAEALAAVRAELSGLNGELKAMVQAEHPVLARIADYYFQLEGKRFRPMLCLLLARALAPPGRAAAPPTLQRQTRLAAIVELIHTASLVHDDVIDSAATRRGAPSAPQQFGNKLAILGGDFLLAQASLALAELCDHDVTAHMSRVLADLVEGEFLQARPGAADRLSFDSYLRKTFLKTASLLAHGCRCVALLADGPAQPQQAQLAHDFGRHFGLAFQLIDDALDFSASAEQLGKPAGQDVRLGLATAPVLFAAEEHAQLLPLIARAFERDGDAAEAQRLVLASRGLQRTHELARQHVAAAVQCLHALPPSPARAALAHTAQLVLPCPLAGRPLACPN